MVFIFRITGNTLYDNTQSYMMSLQMVLLIVIPDFSIVKLSFKSLLTQLLTDTRGKHGILNSEVKKEEKWDSR